MAIPLIHFYEGYFIEFEDSEDRDFLLIKNIKQIEISPQNINSILEYCGTLSYDSQRVFFANIRLYAELFKRLTHAGSTTRELPTTNKNYAINRKLKEIFPYWNSHFTLPCVLSSYKEIAKFSTMWTHIDSVRYIDDFGNREITKEQEGYILNFVKRFEPLVNNKQDEVFCCAEHRNVRKMIKTIRTCQNSNSLNIIFKNIFGKELSEITINK